jgi:hypothetical protein
LCAGCLLDDPTCAMKLRPHRSTCMLRVRDRHAVQSRVDRLPRLTKSIRTVSYSKVWRSPCPIATIPAVHAPIAKKSVAKCCVAFAMEPLRTRIMHQWSRQLGDRRSDVSQRFAAFIGGASCALESRQHRRDTAGLGLANNSYWRGDAFAVRGCLVIHVGKKIQGRTLS